MLAASGRFSKVIGVDPSKGMIDSAKTADPSAFLSSSSPPHSFADVEYRVGSAESLDWLEDESVDLVAAGQAAHWFDHGKTYKELHRILKPGGTVAYWGYSYLFLPDYPEASSKFLEFGLDTMSASIYTLVHEKLIQGLRGLLGSRPQRPGISIRSCTVSPRYREEMGCLHLPATQV